MGDGPPDGNMELLQTKCISILIFTLTVQLLENCETAVVTSNAGTLPRNFGNQVDFSNTRRFLLLRLRSFKKMWQQTCEQRIFMFNIHQ